MSRLHNVTAFLICFPMLINFVCSNEVCALDYIEASNSLVLPEWEGGHTEIEMADINADEEMDIIACANDDMFFSYRVQRIYGS